MANNGRKQENRATADEEERFSGHRSLLYSLSVPILPLSIVLIPLKAWFPILGPVKDAFIDAIEDFASSLFDLIGIFFVGILKEVLFFPPPTEVPLLNTYYNSLIGLFIVLWLLGGGIYVLTMLVYPSAPKANIWRLAERSLVGFIILLVAKPVIYWSIIVTNEAGLYLLPDSYSLALIEPAIKGVGHTVGTGVFGLLVFAIFGSISTLFTVGLFYIVLLMRMLVIYAVFAALPVLVGLWIADIGPMKYPSEATSFTFHIFTIMLVFGIIISGILSVGAAMGGGSLSEKIYVNNSTGVAAPNALENENPQDKGKVLGGIFNSPDNLREINEAGVLTKVFGYFGSMWLVVVLTYGLMGIVISTKSTTRRHHGAGTKSPVGSGAGGGGSSGPNDAIISETGDGGMTVIDPETGRGVYMPERGNGGSPTVFGAEEMFGGGSNGVAVNGGTVTGDQLVDISPEDLATVSNEDIPGTRNGIGSRGSGYESVDGLEPMSLREKAGNAMSAPRDKAGNMFQKAGSAAEEQGFERVGGGLDRFGGGIKKYVTKEGAAAAGYYGATVGGRLAVDEDSGRIHRALGSRVSTLARTGQGIGRAVKGGTVTYGRMFAEEDPIRSAQIGLNAMRRSPIGDPRRSNATGEMKEEYISGRSEREGTDGDAGTSGEDNGDGDGDSGTVSDTDDEVASAASSSGGSGGNGGNGGGYSPPRDSSSSSSSENAGVNTDGPLGESTRPEPIEIFDKNSSYDVLEAQIGPTFDQLEEYGLEGPSQNDLRSALDHQRELGVNPETAATRLNLLANYSELDPVGDYSRDDEIAQQFGIPKLPTEVETDSARARINMGRSDVISGGQNEDNMWMYEFGEDDRTVISQDVSEEPETGPRNLVAKEVLSRLGVNTPEMHLDSQQQYLRSEGIPGEDIGTIAKAIDDSFSGDTDDLKVDPNQIDRESYIGVIAGKTLLGNSDMNHNNIRVHESGQVYSIDDDDTGNRSFVDDAERLSIGGGPHSRGVNHADRVGMDVSKEDIEQRMKEMAEQAEAENILDEVRENVTTQIGTPLSADKMKGIDDESVEDYRKINRRIKTETVEKDDTLDVVEENMKAMRDDDTPW